MAKLFKSVGIYSLEKQPDVMYICTLLPVQLNNNYYVKHIINVSTSEKKALLIVISSESISLGVEENPIAYGFNYSFHKSRIVTAPLTNANSNRQYLVNFDITNSNDFDLIAIYDYNFDITNTNGLAYVDSTIANVKAGTASEVNTVSKVGCCPP